MIGQEYDVQHCSGRKNRLVNYKIMLMSDLSEQIDGQTINLSSRKVAIAKTLQIPDSFVFLIFWSRF